jgi:hypothetical protein
MVGLEIKRSTNNRIKWGKNKGFTRTIVSNLVIHQLPNTAMQAHVKEGQ